MIFERNYDLDDDIYNPSKKDSSVHSISAYKLSEDLFLKESRSPKIGDLVMVNESGFLSVVRDGYPFATVVDITERDYKVFYNIVFKDKDLEV